MCAMAIAHRRDILMSGSPTTEVLVLMKFEVFEPDLSSGPRALIDSAILAPRRSLTKTARATSARISQRDRFLLSEDSCCAGVSVFMVVYGADGIGSILG